MSRRMFEFACEQSHISEALVDEEVREISCRSCGQPAKRIVSAVQSKLDPFTGSFPTAYSAWNRKRAEKLAIEKKQNA